MQKYLTILLCLLSTAVFSQTIQVEGYTFGEGNRGYISNVYVRIQHPDTKENLAETYTDKEGFFKVEIPKIKSVNVFAKKTQYKMSELDLKVDKEKMFVKIEMRKEPGYLFEVTLADKKESPGSPTSAITGALIEIYNNTERKSELVIKDSEQPEFDVNFKKGNHYTMLIRKPGYLSKRMEAFVDVDGCILCFEGVGRVQPGVADNLTDDNAAGVLLANVELEPIFAGKTLEIENIYYDLGKWNITRKAREQLKKVILMLEDNPNLTMELGSHTDSRGKSEFNRDLSEKRANASVEFILKNGNVTRDRVISRGYGEQVILNKCSDGVDCTEAEHSINRRTELKILNVESLNVYKPLAQMKEEEFLEKEVLNQEEVQVTGDQTLQQFLDEKNKEQKNKASEEEIPVEDMKDSAMAKAAADAAYAKELAAKQAAAKESDAIAKAEQQRAATAEKEAAAKAAMTKAKAEQNIAKQELEAASLADPKLESVAKDAQELEQEEVEAGLEEGKELLDKAPTLVSLEESTDGEMHETMEDEVEIISDAPALVDSIEKARPVAATGGLAGHKVVIKKNVGMLSSSSDIVKRHDKLEIYLADDGKVWYMMGGFNSREEAQEALDSFIKTTYPDAFIANFEAGTLK